MKVEAHVRAARPFVILSRITLGVLVIQFLVGMLTNLYVEIPKVHPGAGAERFFLGVVQGIHWTLTQLPSPLFFHSALGLLLEGLAIAILVLGILSRRTGWIVTSSIGWVMVTGACFNGAAFVNYKNEYNSMIMAAAFITAMISYGIGMGLGSRSTPPPASP